MIPCPQPRSAERAFLQPLDKQRQTPVALWLDLAAVFLCSAFPVYDNDRKQAQGRRKQIKKPLCCALSCLFSKVLRAALGSLRCVKTL